MLEEWETDLSAFQSFGETSADRGAWRHRAFAVRKRVGRWVYAALLQHLVHQGGLAVVNVGDDGYVSQMFVLHIWNIPSCFLPSIDNSRQTALRIREERLSILVN